MGTQNRELVLFVSSDPALGATNVSVGCDYWQTAFAKPIVFPSREVSHNYTVELHSGSLWWVVRNISAGPSPPQNNKLTIKLDVTDVDIELDPGLYGITEISNAVAIALVNAGYTGNEVSFTGDSATQKVVTNINATGIAGNGVEVTFPLSGSFGSLMGITPTAPPTYGPVATGVTKHFLADTTAQFSTISGFFYQTDLVSQGIPLGNKSSNAIAKAIINVLPGSLINTTPPGRLLPINADNLAGSTLTHASFWVTSQTGERGLDFGSPTPEFITMTILLRWHEDER